MALPSNMRTDLLVERLLNEDADPVARAVWLALFHAHREARGVLSALYRLGRPDCRACAEDLGVDIMHATKRTPVHISRSEDSQWHDARPVPSLWSRRDFQDAGAAFKALAKLAHELSPDGLAKWANPTQPRVDFDSVRADLVAALLECEEPMRAYAKYIRRQKGMEKLGAQRSKRW